MSFLRKHYFLSWSLIFLFVASSAFVRDVLAGDRTKEDLLNQVAQEYVSWRRLIDTKILTEPLVLDLPNETDTFFNFFFRSPNEPGKVLQLEVIPSPWRITKILLLDINFSDFEQITMKIQQLGYPVALVASPKVSLAGSTIGSDPQRIFSSFCERARELFTKKGNFEISIPWRVRVVNKNYSLDRNPRQNIRFSLNKLSSANMEEALNLIATDPEGMGILEKIFKKFTSGEFTIKEFDINVLFKEKGSKVRGDVNAFVTKGAGIFYVDTLAEVGSLSRTLIHEITHILDEESKREFEELENEATELNEEYKKLPGSRSGIPPTDEARKETLLQKISVYYFKTERKAYDADASFAKRLTNRFPSAEVYFNPSEAKKSNDSIITEYNLDRKAVDEYLKREERKRPLAPEEIEQQRHDFQYILSCCP